MKERRQAGHLLNATLTLYPECIIANGYLTEDLREVNHHGEWRDLGHQQMHTSWVVELEYLPLTDTTVITTRNSFYSTDGNLIKEGLGLDVTKVEGKPEIRQMLHTHLVSIGLIVIEEEGKESNV